MSGNFDSVPAVILMPTLRLIPIVGDRAWAEHWMGNNIRSLVLSYCDRPVSSVNKQLTPTNGLLDWDVLSVYSSRKGPVYLQLNVPVQELIDTGARPMVEFKEIELGEFVMDIETPKLCGLALRLVFKSNKINHSKLEAAHETLWDDLDRPCAEHFLRYWRCVLSYQRSKNIRSIMHDNAEVLSAQDIQDAVIKYQGGGINDWEKKDVGLRSLADEQLCDENEIAAQALMETKIIPAKYLVAILIYCQNFPEQQAVNPVVPLVWWWAYPTSSRCGSSTNTELLHRVQERIWPRDPRKDNLYFTLPAPKIPPGPADSAYCEVDLSGKIDGIDGFNYLWSSKFPWLISTLMGIIMTFFISLAAGSNPSLATSISLLLLRPYSNDYNFADGGTPHPGTAAEEFVGTPWRVGFSTGQPASEPETLLTATTDSPFSQLYLG